ncbi:MAG: kelch repeat-containing protein [Planctomycetota bacterium]|nr:kelch repeat-containing protein [Planctomycetota bacterium]
MRNSWIGLGAVAAVALAITACGGSNAGSGSRQGVPGIPGTQGFQVPALPPDTFTRIDTLTARNPTLQTPFLSQSKDSMTATTLSTGLVVIIGGSAGGSTALQDTEIYDQRSAEFSASGLMGNGRRHHTATLTSAGTIVIIGGVTGGSFDPQPLQSAEVWHSSTGMYTVVQQMTKPRVGHTATALASGEILVAGGFTDNMGMKVTESVETLNLSNSLWRKHTPLQATSSIGGTPRAYHTATLIPGRNGMIGDGDDLLIIIGGVLGDRGTKDITSITNSVLVYYPNDTTQLMSGQSLPGAWRSLGIINGSSEPARLGHKTFFIGNTTNDISQVVFLGGLVGSVGTRMGGMAANSAGFSIIEDSWPPLGLSLAVLDIDNTTLIGLTTPPKGEINQVHPLGTCCQPFVGGIGANAVFSRARLAIIYSGGNTYASPPPTRVGYNRDALLITMSRNILDYITIDTPVGCLAPGCPPFVIATSAGQMGDLRSWHAGALLPGADGLLDTPDDTVLVVGGEQSPAGESTTGDEYTFTP